MSQTRDVLSQDLPAQAIIDYFLTYNNEKEKAERFIKIDHILDEVVKEYTGIDDVSWLGALKKVFVYPVSRGRTSELTLAIDALKKCAEPIPRLAIIAGLLKAEGNHKSTSVHTLILDKLLVESKFNSLLTDNSIQEVTKIDVRRRLRETLVVKAEKCIDQYEEMQRQKQKIFLTAVRPVNPLRVDPHLTADIQSILSRFLTGEAPGGIAKIKRIIPTKKMDSDVLAQRHAMLQAAFTAKEKPHPSKVTLDEEVKPLQMTYEETIVEKLTVATQQPVSSISFPPSPPVKTVDRPHESPVLSAKNGFFAKRNNLSESERRESIDEKSIDREQAAKAIEMFVEKKLRLA